MMNLGRERGLLLNRFKAIILDLDGTLIHTTVNFKKMKDRLIAYLLEEGIPRNVIDPEMTVVKNLKRVREYLRSNNQENRIVEIDAGANQVMSELELEGVEETTAIYGAERTISYLKGKGYKIGLLTRGSRAYTFAALKAAGIEDVFDAIIARDDFSEEEAKPNGKALARMADALGVRPQDCLLVGDHLIDLDCSRSAGASFVGVLTGSYSKERWSGTGVRDLIDSIDSLPEYIQEERY